MKINKTKLKRGVLLLLAVVFSLGFCSSARALLEVTYSQSLALNRIQYYWAGDSSSAASTGRTINKDPNISFDLSKTDYQAKPKTTPPSTVYIFGSDAGYKNSLTTYIRVWSSAAQAAGGKYTALASYSNPAGTLTSATGSLTYAYVRAKPAGTSIYQYTESGTTVLSPLSTKKIVVFYSSSAADTTTGLAVEIGKADWEITKNGGTATTVTKTGTNAKTLTLPSDLTGDTLSVNDVYVIRVRHYNLWNEAGSYSSTVTYTVGAAAAAAAPTAFTFTLYPTEEAKLVVNTIFLPSLTLTLPEAVTVSKASDLQKVVDKASKANIVAAICRWDPVTGKAVVALFKDGKLVEGSTDFTLKLGEAYQIYTTTKLTITLQ